VQPVRVVVADLPGILTDIVLATLERPPDLCVTVVAPGGSAVALADATDADVAILGGAHEGLPPRGYELLRRRPWMNILTIHSDGREAFLHQLRPVERALGEISPQTLLDAVRAVASECS
jgi:hypothetical protein